MITIIDYGAGNLRSVQKALECCGFTSKISNDPSLIKASRCLVLPGQGAFQEAMANLKKMGLVDHIQQHIRNQKPFLGICVGFQILFERSEEGGHHEGLGIYKGEVKAFDPKKQKVPHIGWNTLSIHSDEKKLFPDSDTPLSTYFAHSFYVTTPNKEIVATTTDYGLSFVSSIQDTHLFASQFHLEKSGSAGLNLLRRVIEVCFSCVFLCYVSLLRMI